MLKYKLQEEKEHLTSTQIAKSVKTNPAYIRQLMAALKNASLISNTQGQANACLTKPADEITMLDIYRQWREKSLCFILILIPTQSVEYTDNNKETVTFMENYELFQSLEAPLLHLNLFNHFLRRPVFSDPRTSS